MVHHACYIFIHRRPRASLLQDISGSSKSHNIIPVWEDEVKFQAADGQPTSNSIRYCQDSWADSANAIKRLSVARCTTPVAEQRAEIKRTYRSLVVVRSIYIFGDDCSHFARPTRKPNNKRDSRDDNKVSSNVKRPMCKNRLLVKIC
jgi:hypothetical protein